MYADQFEVRIARVRHRFATTLESKINSTVSSADRMSGDNDNVSEFVTASYRHLHSIAGVGASVGFASTGEAALAAESALIQAYRENRGLSAAEVLNLKEALARLREAAASELRLMYQRGG